MVLQLEHSEKLNNLQGLSYTFLEVTQAAAIAAYKCRGLGDEKLADQAAVDAMRGKLNLLPINGTIVIGEGERDESPMLYIGEKVGCSGYVEVDIAVDPLEGTTICSNGKDGAISVIAITEKGGFLFSPDVYMEKIAVGQNLPKGIVSLNSNIEDNLYNLASAKSCNIRDLVVTVLNRDRHIELIQKIRKCGARIKLIDDGDITAVLSLLNGENDLYVGTGGAPEGVISAAALKSLGGQINGRLIFNTPQLQARALKYGINDFNKIYDIDGMVKSESIFIATGITNSSLVKGIQVCNNQTLIRSVIIRYKNIINIENTFLS